MNTIYSIVEGSGEEQAVPVLLRRILGEAHQRYDLQLQIINARGRNNIIHAGSLERLLEYLRPKPECRGILVLLDAEEQSTCALELAQGLAMRAKQLDLSVPVVIVCAKCEYESWFLASLSSLSAKYGLPAAYPDDPEEKCNAKEWLEKHMPSSYKPTTHQPRMTAYLDFEIAAQNARSFRRLLHALEELLAAIDQNQVIVTPSPAN